MLSKYCLLKCMYYQKIFYKYSCIIEISFIDNFMLSITFCRYFFVIENFSSKIFVSSENILQKNVCHRTSFIVVFVLCFIEIYICIYIEMLCCVNEKVSLKIRKIFYKYLYFVEKFSIKILCY